MDVPGSPFPPDRIPKKPKRKLALQNAIDIALQEVFEAMEMDVEGNDDKQFSRVLPKTKAWLNSGPKP